MVINPIACLDKTLPSFLDFQISKSRWTQMGLRIAVDPGGSIDQVNRSTPPEGTRKIAILRARSSSRFALRSSQHFLLVSPRAQTQSMFPARSASRSDLVNTFSSHRFALRPSQRFQLAARSASRRYTWGGTSIILLSIANLGFLCFPNIQQSLQSKRVYIGISFSVIPGNGDQKTSMTHIIKVEIKFFFWQIFSVSSKSYEK